MRDSVLVALLQEYASIVIGGGDVNECLMARSVPYRRRLNEISRPRGNGSDPRLARDRFRKEQLWKRFYGGIKSPP